MTGQGVRWTAEQVLALAPDAASRAAGSKLAAAGPWSETAASDGAVWGLCRGSGSKPYQTVVDIEGPAYTCSCPSRKFPCKHALGLLLLWAADEGSVSAATGEPPEWAGQWLAGRRERDERAAGSGSGDGDGDGDGERTGRRQPADPEAARRRAELRAQRIAAGATELEQRLADLLRGGIAGADQAGYAAWDEMAARMVDAQAPGLAARIRELSAIPGTGVGWPVRLLEECSLLHLLDQGYLGLDRLPEPLAATVRGQVGLTIDTATLLAESAESEALIRDRWLVLGQRDSEEGRLAVRRIWLRGERCGRLALLLSFGAAGRAPELTLPVGAALEAELAFYPAARPLRAALGERHTEPGQGRVPGGVRVGDALATYGAALCEDPWLDSWPTVLTDVVPVPDPDRPDGGLGQIADQEGDDAIPLVPGARMSQWRLAAISGGGPVTVFGECGHRGFAPHTVWSEGEAVPL